MLITWPRAGSLAEREEFHRGVALGRVHVFHDRQDAPFQVHDIPPMEVPGGDRIAHCMDAQGAAIAFHQSPA